MKNILKWILATLIVMVMIAIVLGGAMLLVHWGHTWVGLIWCICGALMMRQLGNM